MPKRKSSRSREENINHYKKKIKKKLERKIREQQSSISASETEQDVVLLEEEMGPGIYLFS